MCGDALERGVVTPTSRSLRHVQTMKRPRSVSSFDWRAGVCLGAPGMTLLPSWTLLFDRLAMRPSGPRNCSTCRGRTTLPHCTLLLGVLRVL